ncbi:MAG: YXWGXW repeat-containing protein, partial [Planctomycetales bacterium]|nr:YXWGXW repeat-containing protein [Planctomycetales bacterium]
MWSATALPTSAQLPELAPPLAADGNAQFDAQGDGFEVLDRGPIHEAFAEPMVDAGLQGELPEALVPREPPEPINELAPDARPEGANVQWIPGYWMWSPDQNDFVWVSGVWRDAPPGRRWIPGYWNKVAGGFVWSPGFWLDDGAAEIAFLPAPPDSLEQGPSSPAPAENFFWIPGCWVYQNNDYAWRAGYWYQGQENWVWTPAYYSYSPRGYVYVAGYWDRPLVQRGFLYASVYWRSPVYRNAGFYYRPRSVVNTALLITNLFVNPYRSHYYYGGFGPSYANLGYYPWYAYHQRGPRYYDPLFAYHRWHDGRGRNDWYADLRQQYRRFDDWDGPGDHHGGPGRHGNNAHSGNRGGRGDLVLSDYQQLGKHGAKIATRNVTPGERERIHANVDQWRDFTRRRANTETMAGAKTGPGSRGPKDRSSRERGDGGDAVADRGGNRGRGANVGPGSDGAGNDQGNRDERTRGRGNAGGTADAGSERSRGRNVAGNAQGNGNGNVSRDTRGRTGGRNGATVGGATNDAVAGSNNSPLPGQGQRRQAMRLPNDSGLNPNATGGRTNNNAQAGQGRGRNYGAVQAGQGPVRGNVQSGPGGRGPGAVVPGAGVTQESNRQQSTRSAYRPGGRAALPGAGNPQGAANPQGAIIRQGSGGGGAGSGNGNYSPGNFAPGNWGNVSPGRNGAMPSVQSSGRTFSPGVSGGRTRAYNPGGGSMQNQGQIRASGQPVQSRVRASGGQPAMRSGGG